MVCYNAQRNIALCVLSVLNPRNAADFKHNIPHGVNLEKIINVLHDNSHSFKPHACIDVRVRKSVVNPVFILVKLCEHKIPELNETVAFAADLAVGLAAAVFFAAVIINLAARTARPRSDFPKVVLLAHSRNVRGVNPDLLCPYIERFVIILVNRYIELVLREFQILCYKLPCP